MFDRGTIGQDGLGTKVSGFLLDEETTLGLFSRSHVSGYYGIYTASGWAMSFDRRMPLKSFIALLWA